MTSDVFFNQLELKKHRVLMPEVAGRKVTGENLAEANDDASQNAHLDRRKAEPGVLMLDLACTFHCALASSTDDLDVRE